MSNLARIEKIYYAALERPASERAAFLAEACGADAELRREVESLLAFDEQAADFIETPPEDLAASLFEKGANQSIVGKTLNHYRVLAPLDAGGMGEVYLAEDVKLGRKIALKLLPPQFAADVERKKRFELEARAVSALNHPNIITIYGIEEAGNLSFIAAELIEGQTLRERIAEEALTWQETVEIAVQITSALESAHSVGIIHRDIKPANIMIRRDRIVKVLDFGLAKLTAKIFDFGDFATRDQTAPNRVMGTINYMSPEQALGERVDARTDIFSLGVVLYEMLTGAQPFAGGSEAAIYNKILNKDVLLTEIRKDVPADLAEIVRRAMKKNADERFQTAAEMRAALETVKKRLNSGEVNVVKPARQQKITRRLINRVIVSAIVAGAILTTSYSLFVNQTPQVAESFGRVNYARLTKLTGAEMYPSLSPDGKTFLYASRADGDFDIFFQRIGGANPVNLTTDSAAEDTQPVYSPDGESIVFRSDRDGGGGLFLMGATGENVRRLTDFGFYPSWSPDGKEIVFSSDTFEEPMSRNTRSALWAVNVATGEKRQLTEQDAIQPAWSPSGARIAFWGMNEGGQRDVWTISRDGNAPMPVTDHASIDWNPVWSPDGKYLYFISDRHGSMNLWRVALDENSGKILGEPENIVTPSVYSRNLSFSRDGKQFIYVQSENYANLMRADFDPRGEKASEKHFEITPGAVVATNPDISPDGEWIVFDAIGDKQEDLFVIRRDGTNLRQLTGDIYKDRVPHWSPDGKRIAFFSDKTGKYEGWTINADGSEPQKVTNITLDDSRENTAQLPLWSPDGSKLLFNVSGSVPLVFDASLPWENQTPERLSSLNDPNSWMLAFSWSPDGEKLAGWSKKRLSNTFSIFEYSFASRRYEIISDFGVRPVWLTDNRRLIFYNKDKVYLLDRATGTSKEIFSVAPYQIQAIALSKDNRTFVYSLQKIEADIWLGSFVRETAKEVLTE